MCTPAHHHSNGGATRAVYSGNGQSIFTFGKDDVLSCWRWNLTQLGRNSLLNFACKKNSRLLVEVLPPEM